MDETMKLIDQLIAEHKVISEKTLSLEKAANDTSLLSNLKQAKDTFVPGDLSQGESLKKLDEMLKAIDIWLEKHFKREETALLPAVKKYGDKKLITSLDSLLFEHSDLRDRMLHSRKRVDELLGGSLDQIRRYASARDLRVHLNHSRKLLETHAAKENRFFTELRRHLKKATKRKETK